MALPAPTIYDPAKHKPLIHQFASIHAACVLRDGTLATFLPARKGAEMTMDHTKLVEYWLSRSQQVEEGSREIILQYADNNEAGVVGVVSLSMPPSETGPFRSLVEKLLVSPDHRYKGIARRLMEKLEEVALDKHRDLVVREIVTCHPADTDLTSLTTSRCLTQPLARVRNMSIANLDTTA